MKRGWQQLVGRAIVLSCNHGDSTSATVEGKRLGERIVFFDPETEALTFPRKIAAT